MKIKSGFVTFLYKNERCYGCVYNTDCSNIDSQDYDGMYMISVIDKYGWTSQINFKNINITELRYL